MPLTFASSGDILEIKKVGGNDETKHFLENLGFISGAKLSVISDIGGNLIVQIKGTRVAINRAMAKKIMV